jgi:hypothetical protein
MRSSDLNSLTCVNKGATLDAAFSFSQVLDCMIRSDRLDGA